MAKAFPNSTFIGYDFHQPSIEHAAERAHQSGGAGNPRFEVARVKDFPAMDLDLVTCFDVLHDLGDPVGAATPSTARSSPMEPGCWWSRLRAMPRKTISMRADASPMHFSLACVPTSLSQEVGMALGAQAGQRKLTEVIQAGGFSRVRRAAETPLNMILEARH
jgi:Methyltransferase domain